MSRTLSWTRSIAVAVLWAVTAAPGFAQSHPPVEAFGQLPAIRQPILTPDGKHIAVIQSSQGRPVVMVYQTDAPAGTQPILIPTADWIAEGILWANNNRLIIVIKKNYQPTGYDRIETFYRAIAIGADGTNPAVLMADYPGFRYNFSSASFLGRDLNDPDHIFEALYVPHSYGWRLDLLKVDVNTGGVQTAQSGSDGTVDWIIDNHSNVVGRIDATTPAQMDDRPVDRYHLYLNRSGRFEEVASFDAGVGKGASEAGLTQDGTGLVLFGRDDPATTTLERLDLATAKITTLFSSADYDVSGVVQDEWTGRVTGVRYSDDKSEVVYFDPKLQALQEGLVRAFGGMSVIQESANLAGDRLIVAVYSPRTPITYYYLNRTTHQAAPIMSAYPGLTKDDLGDETPYPYKARDGLDIHAYLTLPPGKTAKNLPAVVMPHGGPDARDEITFDWWAQFLANRGYAVLQPNYRGSSGYGKKFTAAGLRQWGLKMQDDITDGVKKLIADGIADPKRICIVGASYGGYATLAGATFTPDLYACAVSWAGVSDLPYILNTELHEGGRNSGRVAFWASRIGSGAADNEKLIATSPARNAAMVKCPILLMHGEADTTVRIDQSEAEYKALLKAGKTVEFIRFSGGEDHYMNVADTRIRMLKETERFLAKYIGN